MSLKSWLQLFRAQTAPASILLVLVPFLTGNPISGTVVVLAVYALLVHYFSFGENSLMDTVMGYDREDPGKRHHPLISGAISLPLAHNVIHWGLIALTTIGVVITYLISPNPLPAMASLVMWVALGHGYNEGLSKESLFGFISISLCFTSMAAWAWFLGHAELTPLGQLYLVYVFMVILFQISWSGHLKEIGQSERSNILIKMGAKLIKGTDEEIEQEILVQAKERNQNLTTEQIGEVKELYHRLYSGEHFDPGPSILYGVAVKLAGICVLYGMLLSAFAIDRLAWFVSIMVLMAFFLSLLTRTRPYIRSSELTNMSVMEILSIFAPLPLMLPWGYAIVLMAAGVVYFMLMNLWLWGTPTHPKV